jgi:Zn-dependent protease
MASRLGEMAAINPRYTERPRQTRAWSWRIAQVAGIRILVHATFPLLVVWFAVASWLETRTLAGVVSGLAFLLLLFACVLFHELGHALTAKRFGYSTREIMLLPIGGVARLEQIPDDPKHSLWISLAGPAVNLVIVALLVAALYAAGAWQPIRNVAMISGPFLERLLLLNVSLVIFNLLPAFPMDGGRVLRALLAIRLDERRATHIAARLGQVMAVGFVIVGWLASPLLIFVGVFVWAGAGHEAEMADRRAALRGIPVSRIMLTSFTTLAPDDRLSTAIERVEHGGQYDFPVMNDGRLVGLLTRHALIRGVARAGRQGRVADAMVRDVLTAAPDDMLAATLAVLEARQLPAAAVIQKDRVVGLLTVGSIAEFIKLQSQLDQAA